MTTKAFSTLTSQIAMHAPGCPPPVIEQALRKAAIELCAKGLVWRARLTAINVVASTYDYTFTAVLPTNSVIAQVLVAKHNNAVIDPLTHEEYEVGYPTQPDTTNTSTPTKYMMVDQRTMRLVPVPESSLANGLKIYAALKPAVTAAGMDEIVLDENSEALVSGALKYLLETPEKNWTNLKLAEFYGKQFLGDIKSAHAVASRGFANTSRRVQPVVF